VDFHILIKFLSYFCLHITKNIAYDVTESLLFCAEKHTHVFNLAILLKSRKSREFDASE